MEYTTDTSSDDAYKLRWFDYTLYYTIAPLVIFFCLVKLFRKKTMNHLKQRLTFSLIMACLYFRVVMEIVDLTVLEDTPHYNSPQIQEYCNHSGFL